MRHPCAPQVWSGTPLAKYFSSVGEQYRRMSHTQQLSPNMWGIPATGWLCQAIRKTAQREHLHYNAMLKAYFSLAGTFAQQTGYNGTPLRPEVGFAVYIVAANAAKGRGQHTDDEVVSRLAANAMLARCFWRMLLSEREALITH
jgi:hypothetical protein